jgi:hypothetical protein
VNWLDLTYYELEFEKNLNNPSPNKGSLLKLDSFTPLHPPRTRVYLPVRRSEERAWVSRLKSMLKMLEGFV